MYLTMKMNIGSFYVVENEVVGYAYASAFHLRAAYKHSAELSLYVRKDCKISRQA